MSGAIVSIPIDGDWRADVDRDHGDIFAVQFTDGISEIALVGTRPELASVLRGALADLLRIGGENEGEVVAELDAMKRARPDSLGYRWLSEPDPPSLESLRDFGPDDAA